jgi:hypothetical protein
VLGEVGPARLVVQLGGWALQRHQQHLQGDRSVDIKGNANEPGPGTAEP